MNTIIAVLKLPERTGRFTIEERETEIVVKMEFTKYGNFGDAAEIRATLTLLMAKYLHDSRTIVIHHPRSGQVARITDESVSITPEPQPHSNN